MEQEKEKPEIITAQINIQIECPGVPNYVKVGQNTVHIADLTDEILDAVGNKWTEKLKAKAASARSNRRLAPNVI